MAHPESRFLESSRNGIAVGFLIGWAIGIAQLLYVGSNELYSWAYVPMIPIYSALGWALFGFIAGVSGIFAKAALTPELKCHFDKQVTLGRIVIAIQVRDSDELDQMTAILYHAGATDVKYAQAA